MESDDESQSMESSNQSKMVVPREQRRRTPEHGVRRSVEEGIFKKIFVKMTKTMAVYVKNTDTIDAVKTKVQEMEGIASSKQKLFFGRTRLKDTQTLDYYNINENSCIDLYVKDGITIVIQTLTKSISLNVKTSDTVSNIKAMIHDKEGVPSDQQTVIFSGKMLDEDQTLASCGVHNNAVLQMLARPSSTLRVTVKLIQGPGMKLEVQRWYTIAQLKLMVGLPQDGPLTLFFSDQELDDNKTLRHYKINDSAVLKVGPSVIQIFVRTLDRKKIVMNVDVHERLSDVYVRIGERLNLNLKKFAIRCKGRYLLNNDGEIPISANGIEVDFLNSNSTFGESGIGDGSTLVLIHKRCIEC